MTTMVNLLTCPFSELIPLTLAQEDESMFWFYSGLVGGRLRQEGFSAEWRAKFLQHGRNWRMDEMKATLRDLLDFVRRLERR